MEAGQKNKGVGTSAYFWFLLQGTLCLLFRLKLAWAGRQQCLFRPAVLEGLPGEQVLSHQGGQTVV